MVCSRGESLTTHRNQMNLKLDKLLTAAFKKAMAIPGMAKLAGLQAGTYKKTQCKKPWEGDALALGILAA